MNILDEARLTYKQRKALPASAFADPKHRKYPLTNAQGKPDPKHARNALSRASGNASPSKEKKIDAVVHRRFPKIGKGKKKTEALAESLVAQLLDSSNFDDVAKKHQFNIARSTLRMNNVIARVMGGMTKKEAAEFLMKHSRLSRDKKLAGTADQPDWSDKKESLAFELVDRLLD